MKNIVVSTKTDTPIYQQITSQIKTQILNGDLLPGTMLPSIRTMAKEVRVSIITIKKAWEELEKEGYINTVAGKGSYVAENTKKTLQKKKTNIINDLLLELHDTCIELDVSEEELVSLIGKLFN
jgi:GntR family transcriptional regulator